MKELKTLNSSELRKLQQVLLTMLREFDEYCSLHNIKYTLEGGTALGAYRHQGFIPWDDDINVIQMNARDVNIKNFVRP